MEGWGLVGEMVVRRVPMLLLVLVGVIVAIIRWRHHPKASLLTILGLLLYVVERTIYIALNYRLSRFFTGPQFSAINFQIVSSILSLVDDFFYAGVIVLLVAAALSQRFPRPATN